MKKLVFSLFFICFTTVVFAQDKGILTGRVLDDNKLPLPGATVVIESLQHGATSNFDGNFTMVNLPTGTYDITVSYIGFETQNVSVEISVNTTAEVKVSMKVKTNSLNQVLIYGSLARGQAKALNQQKTNDNITNVVSADQVGKFPDANTGDALKRIPGIAMQNDQGEARDIIIRGLAPQLNSVTLNGDRIPSAEGDNRRIQLDLIPSDMIQTIQLNKAVTPDMEADAIGGSVNLITRAAPSKLRVSLTGAYGRNPVRESGLYNFSAVAAQRFFNDKLGAVVSASHNSNDYGSDNVEFEWDSPTFIKEHDIRRYDVKRIRRSVSLNLDWKLDPNNTIEFKSIYNHRDDLENRYRLRYKFDDNDTDDASDDEYKITRQTKGGINNDTNESRRLERQKMYRVGLNGSHILFKKVQFDWNIGFSKASEVRPNERYVTYESKQDASTITQQFVNTRTPFFNSMNRMDNDASLFELDEISEERRYTEEEQFTSRFDITIPINTSGKYQNSIKTGYKYHDRDKLRDNTFSEFDTDDFSAFELLSNAQTADQTIDGYLPGDQYRSGTFATNSFLGDLALVNGELVLDEFVPENYNANEKISGAYAMLRQQLGDKFSFIAGLRMEHTNIDYTGFQIDVESASSLADAVAINASKKYTNVLPNVQFRYAATNNTILRFAYTNTIARPNYFDIVPYQNINSDDLEAEFGNPELEAAESLNFDFMAEHYFDNVGIISGGAFYKNIDNFIYALTYEQALTVNGATEMYDVTQPFNGGSAKVFGFEIAFQRKLDFLPSFLKNLTFYGNYTYTNSETDGITGRKDGLELAGAVPNTFNGSLAYETKKLSVRTSLHFADDYIDEYGDKPFEDRYYDSQLFLDLNASYAITKNLRIFGEMKNITNQELRYYQGVKERTMQAEFYDINWNLGLKYNF